MSMRLLLLLMATVALLAAPLVVTDPYFRNVMVVFGIYAILAVSLDIIVGFVGIDSFGHAAFFGGGAYATAITMKAGWPFWLAMPFGALFAALLGLIVSIPALRMRGVYFAITTLACAEIVRLIVINLPELTRGVMGLSVPSVEFPFVEYGGETVAFYYLVVVTLALVCFLFQRFLHSARGRAMLAIRENEALASAVGIPPRRVLRAVFTVSALVAGLAGSIYAPFVGIISPDVISVNYSALAILMVVLGGRGTIYGPIVGAAMFSVVTEFFRIASDLRMIIFSVLLVLAIMLTPRGIAAPLLDYLARLMKRGYAAATPSDKDG
jgi:branched-chain amino acid transport system permease protein